MKKFLFLSVAILAFVLGSCSKEARLNRKLDGKWELTTEDGVAVAEEDKITVEFTKDKDGKGAVTMASTSQGFALPGTYTLDKNEKITITAGKGGAISAIIAVRAASRACAGINPISIITVGSVTQADANRCRRNGLLACGGVRLDAVGGGGGSS